MPGDANVIYLTKKMPNSEVRPDKTADAVIWKFYQSGKEACRYSATVTDNGSDSSRVTTKMEDLSNGQESVLCNIAEIVVDESINATLDSRSADVESVNSQIARYIVSDYRAVTETAMKRVVEMAPPDPDSCSSDDLRERARCEERVAQRDFPKPLSQAPFRQ